MYIVGFFLGIVDEIIPFSHLAKFLLNTFSKVHPVEEGAEEEARSGYGQIGRVRGKSVESIHQEFRW